MGRNKKFFLLVIFIVGAVVAVSLFKSDKTNVTINVKKDSVVINNFEMAKVVDEKNNFYKLNADQAVLNRKARSADLVDFVLVYKKGSTDLTASADKGFLEEEVRMDATGKIQGVINGRDFETGESGSFHYDFETETGVLDGDVTITGTEGTISSDKLFIYNKTKSLEFDGNVKILYKNY
ncbi:protein of unknown function DUF1239 [Denitrovibrio acetiphilus DSM 12809]|uniref:LPS export ABC transporter periplasmic protein LptC n=1 Tax=Denitrovibrio acetiphilus (strain DSM 12809 / NBRC 114555 / N2460) TaxID=522772 RepID=D4H7S9_DENA2|nr:LPS export ABC transporter periplasmic protein LptC [Denitrovibrio acetiphilus]ADD68078.1 protein of unknown function DUF1239 [Denitrovibrio acetiphilus DSM 12809]